MSPEEHLERKSSTWAPFTFTPEDYRDVMAVKQGARHLSTKVSDVDDDDVESFKEEITGGYIYRVNGKAIGCMLFSDYSAFAENTLHIDDLSVLPEYRSAGMTNKILKLLRQHANTCGAKVITWNPVSEIMQQLTRKVGAQQTVLQIPLHNNERTAAVDVNSIRVERLSELIAE